MSTVPAKRPMTVTLAVILLLAMLILGAISWFYQLTHSEALKSLQAQAPHMGMVQHGLLIVSLIFNLFLQYKIFMGRNWARITALVLFLIAVLSSIPSFLGMFPISTTIKVMAPLAMLVQLLAYVMLFSGAGKAWFKHPATGAQGMDGSAVIASGPARSGAQPEPHASHFVRVVYPKLIGFGALGVGVVCIAWTMFMVWGTCRMIPRMMPPLTCASRFAVSMLVRQYWLLTAYAVLSIFTGICLLTRRAWAKRLAMAYLLLSIAYLAGGFGWLTWGLLHDRSLLGDQMIDQFKTFMWIEGIVVAVLTLGLVVLAIVMTRVPWPQNKKMVSGTIS